jgi:hypothetical protein
MTTERTYVGGREWPPSFPTRDEIERHLAQARALRSQATAEMLASGFRSLIHPLRAGRALLVRWRQGPSRSGNDCGASIPAE